MIFVWMLLMFMSARHSDNGSLRSVLNRYFTATIRQDYAIQYSCYYSAYKAKVSKDDYIHHRVDSSILMNYFVESADLTDDRAQAMVLLTFAPLDKLKRSYPVEKRSLRIWCEKTESVGSRCGSSAYILTSLVSVCY